MVLGKQRAEWTRLSRLMALTANCHRTKNPLDWDYFNVYKEPPEPLTEAQREAMAKHIFGGK